MTLASQTEKQKASSLRGKKLTTLNALCFGNSCTISPAYFQGNLEYKMSRKNNVKDLSGLTFDTHTKIVMTSMPHRSQVMLKEKIAAVRAIVPNKSNHEITLVLEHVDYNVEDAIDAFLDDGAAKILKEWNINGSKAIKGSKKNTGEKYDKSQSNKNDVTASTKNAVPKAEKNQEFTDNHKKRENGQAEIEIAGKDAQKSALGATTTVLPTAEPDKIGKWNRRQSDSRQNSFSEGANASNSSGLKGKKVTVEKSIKDMSRHALTLHRYGNMLDDEVEKSLKRLKQAFKELRLILDTRENDLVKQLEKAKLQGRELLEMRQKTADELKLRSQRADTMSEAELNDLRIDIKQFVADRRLDEDLGRSLRLVRDHDRLVKEINAYGEVTPVKDEYIKRKRSVDSAIVDQPMNATVTLSAPNRDNRIPSTTATSETVTVVPKAPPVASSNTLSTSELAELQQRLCESLKLQGLPLNNTSSINRPMQKDRYFAPRSNLDRKQFGSGTPSGSKDQEAFKGTEQTRHNFAYGNKPSQEKTLPESRGSSRRRFDGGKPRVSERTENK